MSYLDEDYVFDSGSASAARPTAVATRSISDVAQARRVLPTSSRPPARGPVSGYVAEPISSRSPSPSQTVADYVNETAETFIPCPPPFNLHSTQPEHKSRPVLKAVAKSVSRGLPKPSMMPRASKSGPLKPVQPARPPPPHVPGPKQPTVAPPPHVRTPKQPPVAPPPHVRASAVHERLEAVRAESKQLQQKRAERQRSRSRTPPLPVERVAAKIEPKLEITVEPKLETAKIEPKLETKKEEPADFHATTDPYVEVAVPKRVRRWREVEVSVTAVTPKLETDMASAPAFESAAFFEQMIPAECVVPDEDANSEHEVSSVSSVHDVSSTDDDDAQCLFERYLQTYIKLIF